MTICTITTTATGETCGKPAVHTFTGTAGEKFAECAEHTTAHVGAGGAARHEIGAIVEIERHGKTYPAKVVEVGARGAVYAEVTYGTGATRRVRI